MSGPHSPAWLREIVKDPATSPDDRRPPGGGARARAGSPLLNVTGLTVQVGHTTILDNVSFTVPRGITLAIVGPNGAGKSTLLRVLLGRIPYAGRVEWNGPARIGYVPQKLVDTDIPLSVRELLSLRGPGNYEACLAMVGLGPGLLEQQIGTLSGGEMQRVLIGWATIDRPEVLLFDEPTSNVDVGSEDTILQAVRRVQVETGATVFLVTHDLHELHHYADQVLVLNRRVIFEGGVTDLLSNSALVAETFGLRADELPPFELGVRR